MRRSSLKFLCGALLAGLVAGCAPVPPALMLASQAIDGISYLATGKSGSDHALSAALDEDCALHRVLTGDPVCRVADPSLAGQSDLQPDLQTASLMAVGDADPLADVDGDAFGESVLAPAGADPTSVAARDPGMMSGMAAPGADMFFAPYSGIDRGAVRPLHSAPESSPVSGGEDTAAVPAPRYFVVLGSFGNRANADHAVERVVAADLLDAPLTPRVVASRWAAGPMFRVVVGPFGRDHADATHRQLADVGFGPTWTATACADEAFCGND